MIFYRQTIVTIETKKGVIYYVSNKIFSRFYSRWCNWCNCRCLLAPKSGEETRALIADGAKDAVRRADETVKEIQSKADDVVSDMQKKGDEIKEKIQNLINQQKEAKQEA